MQVNTSSTVPAYVATAFVRMQQDHLWDENSFDTNDDIVGVLQEIQQEEKVQTTQVIVKKLGDVNMYAAGRTAVQILEQAFEANITPERRERIKAEVAADVARILGNDAQPVQEADPCVSEVRIVKSTRTVATIPSNFTEGVWEAPKRMADVVVHRQLPEDLKDAVVAKSHFVHEFTQHQTDVGVSRPVAKLVDKSLLEWLAMVDRETPEFAKKEIESRNGRESIEAVRRYLFENERHVPSGLNNAVAAEFESFGYGVAYDRVEGVLLFSMKSGSIRWVAV